MSETGPAAADAVIWHDVECAGYACDLEVWRSLAAAAPGPVLDVGCGSGRVALDLAGLGHQVTGIDSDPALIRTLAARARERALRVRAHALDARSLDLGGRTFSLAIAPMQVVQLLGGRAGRISLLAALRRHLEPGALFAAALADPFDGLPAEQVLPPMPDVREQDGWVYSSTPVAVRAGPGGALAIDRVREAVSPTGALTDSVATIVLDRVDPGRFEEEAAEVGYRRLPRRRVPESDGYVGSTVVVLEAP